MLKDFVNRDCWAWSGKVMESLGFSNASPGLQIF